jgi:very-short-patch-repair endonuclease
MFWIGTKSRGVVIKQESICCYALTCENINDSQQVIAGFIVDFYCHKAALVVEVDGDIHDLQQEEDAKREKVLREMGLRIVRFGNEEIVRDLSAVVGRVREVI